MILTLLLVACTGAPDDTAEPDSPAILDCAEEGECCHASLPPLWMCFETLQRDEALVGTFDRWAASGEITFTTTAGDVVPVWFRTDAEALSALPDLAAAGEVTITQQGGCDPKGGIDAAVHIAGPSGDTLLLAGAVEVTDLGGWTVDADFEDRSCGLVEQTDGCWEYSREVPVRVLRGDDGGAYWQGDEASFGPHYTVRVNSATFFTGELSCEDVGDSALNYWIVGPG